MQLKKNNKRLSSVENKKNINQKNGQNYIKKRSNIWVMEILEGEGKMMELKNAYLSERMAKNAFLFDNFIHAYNVF